jgi:hypothetical protein
LHEEIFSSVRLLESSSGSFTTEFLGFASSGISNEEMLVVLKEDFLELSLLLLIMIFLVVCEEGFSDGLSDCHDLVGRTTTSDSHSDIDVFESVSSDKQDGLEYLQSQ